MFDCTMVVNSCDSYDDTWDLFFRLLSINWPNCDIPITINTESK